MQDVILRKLFLGFIQIHILHHAAKAPFYGAWMMEELAHHGYDISAGTSSGGQDPQILLHYPRGPANPCCGQRKNCRAYPRVVNRKTHECTEGESEPCVCPKIRVWWAILFWAAVLQ